MESSCLRHTALPHTTALFADFLYRFDRVARFYPHNPGDPDSFRRSAAAIEYPDARRASLVAALRQQNGSSSQLDALAKPGTAAVVTGQQVGLFSGPLYTVLKALTAAKLAKRLSESGIPAVPVFWLATEDHDFAEVNHCWVFDARQRPRKLEVLVPETSGRPVGGIRPNEFPVQQLRAILQDFPFGDETTELVAQAYSGDAEFGSAFAALLKRLLGKCGILCLDPMQPAIRELAAPLLSKAVVAAPDLTSVVLQRSRELNSAGYHAQVYVEDKTSFVFLLEDGRRMPLQRNGGDYVSNGRRFSTRELMERAESLSPNALLRPVAQDFILPTVAYVGGPAELAYLAQSQVLYEALLGRMPVPVHRQSATLLDGRAAKLLPRYGLELPDFFRGEENLRERIAARLVPPSIAGLINDKRAQVSEILDQLNAGLAGFDATLAATLDTSRRKILYQLSKVERKVARETFRRNQRAADDAAYLNGLIYPEKHLQERFYSVLPFLARHGLDLIGRLYDEVELDCPDHRISVVS